MTIEECIALLYRYAEYDGIGIPNLAGCKDAMKMAADLLSQPSLPSDLDEAAHRYAWEKQEHHIDFDGNEYLDYGPRYDAFKAGAEWMAGQGAFYNTKVGWIDGPTILDWPDDILDKFEIGDEVIVQIRKK